MAGIIKAHGSQKNKSGTGHVAFNFDDMSEKAKSYLDTVRGEAGKIISNAEQQATQVRNQAEQQGQQAAIQSAEQQINTKLSQQMQTVLPAMQQAIDSIIQTKQAWLLRWENTAIALATAIAERIVRRELSQQPEITVDLVREALQLATGNDGIKIHLNPQDYETLGEQVKHIAARLDSIAPAEIISDGQVRIGGCIVKTEFGEIDQQIESQLQRIETELT